MSAHLILITLGPVQEFIAQARRTRDLWFGSHLLSELARATARSLAAGGAHLIFPALERGDAELAMCLEPRRANGQDPLNIANKVLAEVPTSIDPEALARTARADVMAFWSNEIAQQARERVHGVLAPGADAIWQEQIESFLEFNAGWLPLAQGVDYADVRQELELAVAGRKLLRDFAPWQHSRKFAPKSSLDGARESVLCPPRERASETARRYRIADGEQLDAVGLVKRAGGKPDQFLPISNVALACWVAAAEQHAPEQLEAARQAAAQADIGRIGRNDLPAARQFPFDASALLPSRWPSLTDDKALRAGVDPIAWGRENVQPLLRRMHEPSPYVACLVADGDHMGAALSSLHTPAAHREFSRALATFASKARRVVEQEHYGSLVYAGGDDVVAFVPVPLAVECAKALRDAFEASMRSACEQLPADARRPTLSVGIGIGHLQENMGDLLELGRQAERHAKVDRNALAVLVDKRSGGTHSWRGSWNDRPHAALTAAIDRVGTELPSRKLYEMAALLRRLPPASAKLDGGYAQVLRGELQRSFGRIEGGARRPEKLGLPLDDQASYVELREQVERWINLHLIARLLAQATPRPRGASEDA